MSVAAPVAHLRVARPVTDLRRSAAMYCKGLAWEILGSFRDHGGFDGVMLGPPGAAYHVEFVHQPACPVIPSPTAEDLLVLYFPEETAWSAICASMAEAGFRQIAPANPYWAVHGQTFVDHDGYRTVIECSAWKSA